MWCGKGLVKARLRGKLWKFYFLAIFEIFLKKWISSKWAILRAGRSARALNRPWREIWCGRGKWALRALGRPKFFENFQNFQKWKFWNLVNWQNFSNFAKFWQNCQNLAILPSFKKGNCPLKRGNFRKKGWQRHFCRLKIPGEFWDGKNVVAVPVSGDRPNLGKIWQILSNLAVKNGGFGRNPVKIRTSANFEVKIRSKPSTAPFLTGLIWSNWSN